MRRSGSARRCARWSASALRGGLAVLRDSVGRYGETAVLHRSDDDLAALVHDELGRLLGAPLPVPEAVRVTRWGGALPQYAPGHLDRVARARAALADVPGLALAGAAYDGVGIAACVRAGWAAAGRAEFNKSHLPAFLPGDPARRYLCVYPFVRSYEWYLLPDEERRELLAEHGRMAREYPDVRANTVASFALGDYEWILAFEADELHRIVDVMRHLRGSRARLHVREEIPFYTGVRKPVAELIPTLP